MFKNFIRNLKLGVDKPPIVWYNNNSEREVIKMSKKKDKRERKMTPPTVTRTLTYEVEGLCPKEWQGLQEKPKAQRKGTR